MFNCPLIARSFRIVTCSDFVQESRIRAKFIDVINNLLDQAGRRTKSKKTCRKTTHLHYLPKKVSNNDLEMQIFRNYHNYDLNNSLFGQFKRVGVAE